MRIYTFKAAAPILGGFFGGKGIGFGVALIGGFFRTFYLGELHELTILIPMTVAGGFGELWRNKTYNPKDILKYSVYILLIYKALHLTMEYSALDVGLGVWLSRLPNHILIFIINLATISIFLGVVEELRRSEEHMGVLHQLALTDEMTKTYNYCYFRNYLKEQIKKHNLKLGGSITLLLIDLDNFKEYNDTFGHQQGDELLKENANLLRRSIRPRDVMSRYGGDEFAIILPETSDRLGYNVGERLRQRIQEKRFFVDKSTMVTISVGVATYKEWMEVDDFLKSADDALYAAKEKGKNNVSMHKSCYQE